MINTAAHIKKSSLVLLLIFFSGLSVMAQKQVQESKDSVKLDTTRLILQHPKARIYDAKQQYDFSDLVNAILHPHRKDKLAHTSSGFTVVPNVSANPTIGFQGGIKAVAGLRLGGDPNTLLSVGATSASYTTKGILIFYLNHNVFTPGNKWNLQGNIGLSKSVTPDNGFGIGEGQNTGTAAQQILADPTHKVYAIHSFQFNFREKVYKQVAKSLFLGAGVAIEHRWDMHQTDTLNNHTPMSVYNNQNGLPQDRYTTAGFLFNVEYITRDNPNRAFTGVYFDAGVRINQTWIGSTKNAVQFTSDLRKYVSLSATTPELVLAFWNWGSYLANGTLPYLELPGTARDGSFRSGRGYTAQYFKGTEYNDTEAEFRFPILANKFLSGVAFGNLQTTNDQQGTKIFQTFQPGYGAGLRVLFNKVTRTNLALDYAFGKFGNRGFFLNLNEAF